MVENWLDLDIKKKEVALGWLDGWPGWYLVLALTRLCVGGRSVVCLRWEAWSMSVGMDLGDTKGRKTAALEDENDNVKIYR